MKYNSLLATLYLTGLYETFCFVNPGTCYLFDFDFKKDSQPQKSFKLTMENL